MGNIITDLVDRKNGKPCPICNEMHIPQNKFRHETLARRIALLKEANKQIPGILQANKEAVDTARVFQNLIKEADWAFDLIENICKRECFKEDGPMIWKTFMEELEAQKKKTLEEEAKKCQDKETTSQDTKEPDSNTENSTLKETSDKPSTGIILNGKTLQPDS